MVERERIVFVCPGCAGSAPVTPPVRVTLLEEGCVFCGASVTPGAFASDRHSPE